MANKLSLKEIFLKENEMSTRYGLDMDTPKGVYVHDTTQNKVIAHTDEEPIDEADMQQECGCGAPSGPHLHRVGAPGGPNLDGDGGFDHGIVDGGLGPAGGEADLGASIIMVGNRDPYHNEAGGPGSNPDPEQEVLLGHDPQDEYAGEEEHYRDVAGYHDSDRGYNNDWKPRPGSLEECDELDKRKESEDMQFDKAEQT